MGCGGVQSLVQRFERERAPPLCLRSGTPRDATLEEGVAPGGGHVCAGEGHAEAHGHQDVEDLGRDAGNKGLDGTWEELGKGERFARITAERGRLRGVEVGEDGLVEAQIRPARQEAKDGEEEGRAGEEWCQGEDGDQSDVQQREPGNPKREDASEEGDGMRRDELAEGDEEANLQRYRAGNGCQSAYRKRQ